MEDSFLEWANSIMTDSWCDTRSPEEQCECAWTAGRMALYVSTSETAAERDRLKVQRDELVAAAEKTLDFFTETRSGQQWTESGGTEARDLRAAIARAKP